MDLQELFNEEMQGGPQIEGMVRSNGHFYEYKDDGSLHILFDTGNLFIIENKNVVGRIDAGDEYFIDKQIIKAIYAFIDSNPAMKVSYNYSETNYEDQIELTRTDKNSQTGQPSILVRFNIDRNLRTITITNILIPHELCHNSYGKGIIKEIFKAGERHGYQLFLVQVVQGFYDRLVARGAKIIVEDDVVEINAETNLS